MPNPQEFADKFITKRKENVAKFSELAYGDLGKALVEILESGKEPTRDNLIAIIKNKISQTSSAQGKIAADLDYLRSSLDAALELLTSSPNHTEE